MSVYQILTVAGSIFMNLETVNAKALASLSEESDLNCHLGLSHNDLEIAVSQIESYYQINLGENVLKNANMKFWIETIIKLKEFPTNHTNKAQVAA